MWIERIAIALGVIVIAVLSLWLASNVVQYRL
jgi:hypothetical protein